MVRHRNLSILQASTVGLFQRGAQLLSSLITLPLALHALGVNGFGIWGAATSLAWISSLLTVGIGAALVALIPASLSSGDVARSRAHVTASFMGGCVLATLLLLGGSAVILFTGAPVPSPPFLIAGVSLILNIPLSINGDLWLALQKGHVGALWALVQTVLSLILIVLGTRLGFGVTFMTAAIYVPMLAASASSLAHVLYTHHHLRPNRRLNPQALREVLAKGGLFFAMTAAAACCSSFDNVMTLAWLGPAASGQMAVVMRVCVTASLLVSAITQPFWPGFGDALAAGDVAWARRTLKAGTVAVLVLGLSGSACLVAVGQPVLNWWLHQNLHLPRELLLAMAYWIVSTTFIYVPSALLNAAGRLKPQIIILTAAALAGFVLKFFTAHSFGVTGILAVTPALWLTIVAPLFLWLAWRVVR